MQRKEDTDDWAALPLSLKKKKKESAESEANKESLELPDDCPILALRDTVLFPGIVIPITMGRKKSRQAIQKAYEDNGLIGVVSQKEIDVEDPMQDDLHHVGVIAKILEILKISDDTSSVILRGDSRFSVSHIYQYNPYLRAKVLNIEEQEADQPQEMEAIAFLMVELSEKIIKLSPHIPSDAVKTLRNIKDHYFLTNFLASNLDTDVATKQQLLEMNNPLEKAEAVLKQLDKELQLLQLKNQIDTKVRDDIEKQQRDYFLNQQLRTIQNELGNDPQTLELQELEKRAQEKNWPKEAEEKFAKVLKKVKRTNPAAAEYSVFVSYLELILDLPWGSYTQDNFDLKRAEDILNKDHFGLKEVKDRILEHLAVLKLRQDMKSPILCLVGPPGVGKTSLGKSIATALDRKYIRMSLGGLHDEAELRGHRKTYIGAMPGRLIQSLKKAAAANPVFVLDEIDKLGKGYKGDPSSALLEILDPEQNTSFYDNYLELEYDLSKVLFIATANSLSPIQPALLDRMEIIEVSGYSVEEKVCIAQRYLMPKQLKENGLEEKHLAIEEDLMHNIVQEYTRESGVRSLDRTIAKIMRSIAKKVATESNYEPKLKLEDIRQILGPRKVKMDAYEEDLVAGVAIGLAWTRTGGDILFVEVSLSEGKGSLTLTGNLGDVMKESATTALSFIRAHASKLGISTEKISKTNVHLHVPAGAIPKDGPSAGIAMLSAMSSAFAGKPLKPYLAMTGEITLRGKVLPVGGIKEKVLAAKRAGIQYLVLCQENEKNVLEIDENYIKNIEFHYVSKMTEVLDYALS